MFGRVYPSSLDKIPFSKELKDRQKVFFANPHFKSGKLLLPTIAKIIDEMVKEYRIRQKIKFNDIFYDIALVLVLTVIFGKEKTTKNGIKYLNSDYFFDNIDDVKVVTKKGKKPIKMEFYDAYQYIIDFANSSFYKAVENGVSDLDELHSKEPFVTEKKNIDQLYSSLEKYLIRSGMKKSIFESNPDLVGVVTTDKILNDIFNMIDAGSGSSYLAVMS